MSHGTYINNDNNIHIQITSTLLISLYVVCLAGTDDDAVVEALVTDAVAILDQLSVEV